MFGDITRIGANFHAMESLTNLKRVNGSIGQVQSRLSSGKRINSAEDDTSGYIGLNIPLKNGGLLDRKRS